MSERRYDQYPTIARSLRAMTPEGRQLVAHWHRILTTALEGAIPAMKTQALAGMLETAECSLSEAHAASGGAEGALTGWLRVMRDVAGIIVDPSEADWCCKPGMLAHPEPCPQHGFDPKQTYELGTVIRRPYGEGWERAVKVYDNSESPCPWRSIEYPFYYNWAELRGGNWTVVGRV